MSTATTHIFVDQQLLVTIFLVMLLWSLQARLHKQDFFRWWAWAWTSFTGYLGMGALALRLAPAWTFLKGSLVLASLICGFLEVPLLAFGACALQGQGKPRRVWLRTGIAVPVAASALIFAAAVYYREQPFASFAVRTVPRTLTLAASLFLCAWVFIGQGRRNRSFASVIAGASCLLYALDQSFYSLIFIDQLPSGLRPPFAALLFRLRVSPMAFSLDLISEFGICLGTVLLLVEAHQRTELALLTSNLRADVIAESNVALKAEISERKLTEAALANVSGKLIKAQEQERARIGRELHDDIGQRLSLVAIQLQRLQESSLVLPEVRSSMGELQKQTTEIATDIQSLSHELLSAKLQYLGIARAVRGFCREFGEQQKVEVDFQTHDLPGPLSADISLCLFRVLQEALHNSAKHSGARHFEVRLWGTSEEIHLTVRDSGAGFDREAAKTSRGLGLITMDERVKLLKGTLSIESQPQHGTTIHARVPLGSVSDSLRAAG